jgi:RNA polymerase sigma-70 factor (ECF subfamily)
MSQTDKAHREYEQSSDVELFEAFLAGDDKAFGELFDRYDRRLRLYCTKIVGDRDLASDMVQRVWERVVRMRIDPLEIHQPERYLLRMARNVCLKHIERSRQSESIDDLYESQHPVAASHEPSHLEELVRIAIDRLPFDQREVLILHNYIGYSYEEIGALREESLG